jgi:hypothetical protein
MADLDKLFNQLQSSLNEKSDKVKDEKSLKSLIEQIDLQL